MKTRSLAAASGLAVCFKSTGVNSVSAGLQINRHFAQMLHARVVQSGQRGFRLAAPNASSADRVLA